MLMSLLLAAGAATSVTPGFDAVAQPEAALARRCHPYRHKTSACHAARVAERRNEQAARSKAETARAEQGAVCHRGPRKVARCNKGNQGKGDTVPQTRVRFGS
ncbi:hypothetical protein [Altericroceibacterium endophyticum]|uniref:Uncharacterized protein n=1 Tax=Altericroceibacterium endophyticum TaxID=1808508 RepID=A0A6I4T9V5_9SPHN|nr:hypothetical protein [Altericroceibacterium endophyticum]MXO66650.1 hypothetical protein [Altericroceibacterium endophyticum]